MNAEEFIDRFVDQYPTNHAELRILLDSFLESQPKQLSDEVKGKLIEIRDALVAKDYDEAYHVLYSIASPEFDNLEPWADFEQVKDRTGGGVDLEKELNDYHEWFDGLELSPQYHMYSIKDFVSDYITHRNQQEKG